jgi:hypothetical protein
MCDPEPARGGCHGRSPIRSALPAEALTRTVELPTGDEPCHNRLMGDSGEPSRFCCGACEHVELAAQSGGSYVASPQVIAGTGGAVLMVYSRGQMCSITLEPGTRLTIGTAPGNGIQLDDPFLDRRASELEITAHRRSLHIRSGQHVQHGRERHEDRSPLEVAREGHDPSGVLDTVFRPQLIARSLRADDSWFGRLGKQAAFLGHRLWTGRGSGPAAACVRGAKHKEPYRRTARGQTTPRCHPRGRPG